MGCADRAHPLRALRERRGRRARRDHGPARDDSSTAATRPNFIGSVLGLDSEKVFPDAGPVHRFVFRRGIGRSLAIGAAIHECGGARMGSDPARPSSTRSTRSGTSRTCSSLTGLVRVEQHRRPRADDHGPGRSGVRVHRPRARDRRIVGGNGAGLLTTSPCRVTPSRASRPTRCCARAASLLRDHDRGRRPGQQRVSELPETAGNSGNRRESALAQPSRMGTVGNGSGVLAMQKVEGSSPFIRFARPAGNGGFLLT